jgi:hypothetical protein
MTDKIEIVADSIVELIEADICDRGGFGDAFDGLSRETIVDMCKGWRKIVKDCIEKGGLL